VLLPRVQHGVQRQARPFFRAVFFFVFGLGVPPALVACGERHRVQQPAHDVGRIRMDRRDAVPSSVFFFANSPCPVTL
jgi:hypothetical protein